MKRLKTVKIRQLQLMQWNKLDVLGSERLDGQLLEVFCLLHVKQHQITIYMLMKELVELI
jgi:hypothetical protein